MAQQNLDDDDQKLLDALTANLRESDTQSSQSNMAQGEVSFNHPRDQIHESQQRSHEHENASIARQQTMSRNQSSVGTGPSRRRQGQKRTRRPEEKDEVASHPENAFPQHQKSGLHQQTPTHIPQYPEAAVSNQLPEVPQNRYGQDPIAWGTSAPSSTEISRHYNEPPSKRQATSNYANAAHSPYSGAHQTYGLAFITQYPGSRPQPSGHQQGNDMLQGVTHDTRPNFVQQLKAQERAQKALDSSRIRGHAARTSSQARRRPSAPLQSSRQQPTSPSSNNDNDFEPERGPSALEKEQQRQYIDDAALGKEVEEARRVEYLREVVRNERARPINPGRSMHGRNVAISAATGSPGGPKHTPREVKGTSRSEAGISVHNKHPENFMTPWKAFNPPTESPNSGQVADMAPQVTRKVGGGALLRKRARATPEDKEEKEETMLAAQANKRQRISGDSRKDPAGTQEGSVAVEHASENLSQLITPPESAKKAERRSDAGTNLVAQKPVHRESSPLDKQADATDIFDEVYGGLGSQFDQEWMNDFPSRAVNDHSSDAVDTNGNLANQGNPRSGSDSSQTNKEKDDEDENDDEDDDEAHPMTDTEKILRLLGSESDDDDEIETEVPTQLSERGMGLPEGEATGEEEGDNGPQSKHQQTVPNQAEIQAKWANVRETEPENQAPTQPIKRVIELPEEEAQDNRGGKTHQQTARHQVEVQENPTNRRGIETEVPTQQSTRLRELPGKEARDNGGANVGHRSKRHQSAQHQVEVEQARTQSRKQDVPPSRNLNRAIQSSRRHPYGRPGQTSQQMITDNHLQQAGVNADPAYGNQAMERASTNVNAQPMAPVVNNAIVPQQSRDTMPHNERARDKAAFVPGNQATEHSNTFLNAYPTARMLYNAGVPQGNRDIVPQNEMPQNEQPRANAGIIPRNQAMGNFNTNINAHPGAPVINNAGVPQGYRDNTPQNRRTRANAGNVTGSQGVQNSNGNVNAHPVAPIVNNAGVPQQHRSTMPRNQRARVNAGPVSGSQAAQNINANVSGRPTAPVSTSRAGVPQQYRDTLPRNQRVRLNASPVTGNQAMGYSNTNSSSYPLPPAINHAGVSQDYREVMPQNEQERRSLYDALSQARVEHFEWTGYFPPMTNQNMAYDDQFWDIWQSFERWWNAYHPGQEIPDFFGLDFWTSSITNWRDVDHTHPWYDLYFEAYENGHRAPRTQDGQLVPGLEGVALERIAREIDRDRLLLGYMIGKGYEKSGNGNFWVRVR